MPSPSGARGRSFRIVAPAFRPTALPDIGALKLVPEGVKAGDRVVVSPPPGLQDGASVATSE